MTVRNELRLALQELREMDKDIDRFAKALHSQVSRIRYCVKLAQRDFIKKELKKK